MRDWLFELVDGEHWKADKRLRGDGSPFPTHAETEADIVHLAAQHAMARALAIARIHFGLIPARFARANRREDPDLFRELLARPEVDAALFWLDVLERGGATDPYKALAENILGFDIREQCKTKLIAPRHNLSAIKTGLNIETEQQPVQDLFEEVVADIKVAMDWRDKKQKRTLTPTRERTFVSAVGRYDYKGLRLSERLLLRPAITELEQRSTQMASFLLDNAIKNGNRFGWARDIEGRTVTPHETAKVISGIAGASDLANHSKVQKAAASLKAMRDEKSGTWLHGRHGPTDQPAYLSTAFCCRALYRVFGDKDPVAQHSAEKLETFLRSAPGKSALALEDGFHRLITAIHALRAVLTPSELENPQRTLKLVRQVVPSLQNLSHFAPLADDPERYVLALSTALLALREVERHAPTLIDHDARFGLKEEVSRIAHKQGRLKQFVATNLPGEDGRTYEFTHVVMPWLISALTTVPEANKALLVADSLALTRHVTAEGGADFRPGHEVTSWGTAYAYAAIRRTIDAMKASHEPGAFDPAAT